MAQVNLPEGLSPGAITAALQFLAAQAQEMQERPSGLLPANMIRGVKKNYKYEYREFPKALTPPDIEVADATQEKRLRVKWNQPLPWRTNDPEGKQYIAEYYASREYPYRMSPPQVIVHNDNEEASVRAGWQAEFGSSGPRMYPAWVFHASKDPVQVMNAKDEERLGAGWYSNPQEAMNAAKNERPAQPASEEIERIDLIKRAEQLEVPIDARMKTGRIRQLVEAAEEKRKAA